MGAFALALAWSGVATAQVAEFPSTHGVEKPFVTEEARQAFRTYVDRINAEQGTAVAIPESFWRTAPIMDFYGYEFTAPANGEVTVSFNQTYSGADVVRTIERSVGTMGGGSCSFVNPSNFQLSSDGNNSVNYSVSLNGKVRACGDYPWPFSGTWKTDIADVNGSASGSYGFSVVPTPEGERFRGELVARDPTLTPNINVSIFGINPNSVVGQVIDGIRQVTFGNDIMRGANSAVPVWSNMQRSHDAMMRPPALEFVTARVMEASGGSVSTTKYRGFLADLLNFTWSIQPWWEMSDELTNFGGGRSDLQLNIGFQTKVRSGASAQLAYESVVGEIQLLRSFSEQSRTVVAARRDSYWEISRTSYGTPYLYHALAAANGVTTWRRQRLREGQMVAIPPLHELVAPAKFVVVHPGDTLMDICKRMGISPGKSCRRELQDANPRRSLRRLYAMDALFRPGAFPGPPPPR